MVYSHVYGVIYRTAIRNATLPLNCMVSPSPQVDNHRPPDKEWAVRVDLREKEQWSQQLSFEPRLLSFRWRPCLLPMSDTIKANRSVTIAMSYTFLTTIPMTPFQVPLTTAPKAKSRGSSYVYLYKKINQKRLIKSMENAFTWNENFSKSIALSDGRNRRCELFQQLSFSSPGLPAHQI